MFTQCYFFFPPKGTKLLLPCYPYPWVLTLCPHLSTIRKKVFYWNLTHTVNYELYHKVNMLFFRKCRNISNTVSSLFIQYVLCLVDLLMVWVTSNDQTKHILSVYGVNCQDWLLVIRPRSAAQRGTSCLIMITALSLFSYQDKLPTWLQEVRFFRRVWFIALHKWITSHHTMWARRYTLRFKSNLVFSVHLGTTFNLSDPL